MGNRRRDHETVSYSTTAGLIYKGAETGKWILTLRQPNENGQEDYWWSESFDAAIVAAGHYSVPFIPYTAGLTELSQDFPGSVEHSNVWCKPEKYRGRRVAIVGVSISKTGISSSLIDVAEMPLNSVVRGKYHLYFSDWEFQHPNILQ